MSRDDIAVEVMKSLLARLNALSPIQAADIAQAAYGMADAMITERMKKDKK